MLPLALPFPVAPEEEDSVVAATVCGTTVRAFLLPNPARGRDAAVLGMKKPPPGAEGAAARAGPDPSGSSDNVRVLSPNTMGSG